MVHTLRDDLATLLDLLAILPPLRGDYDVNGDWDQTVKVPRFWSEFLDATQNQMFSDRAAEQESWLGYMSSKLRPHAGNTPVRATDAAELASYCLMFFAVSGNDAACALLGRYFTT